MQGDTAKACTAYNDFLTLWKDADPDIPILKEAKAEYAAARTGNTWGFPGGLRYSPTMSSSLASKSGSGLKVNLRIRWGCSLAATSMACTVLAGNATSAASVRTVQRL